MVDLTAFVDCNPRDFGIHEKVYYPVLAKILEEFGSDPEKLAGAIKTNPARSLDRPPGPSADRRLL